MSTNSMTTTSPHHHLFLTVLPLAYHFPPLPDHRTIAVFRTCRGVSASHSSLCTKPVRKSRCLQSVKQTTASPRGLFQQELPLPGTKDLVSVRLDLTKSASFKHSPDTDIDNWITCLQSPDLGILPMPLEFLRAGVQWLRVRPWVLHRLQRSLTGYPLLPKPTQRNNSVRTRS